jgi:hypothetical protein
MCSQVLDRQLKLLDERFERKVDLTGRNVGSVDAIAILTLNGSGLGDGMDTSSACTRVVMGTLLMKASRSCA